MAKRWTHKSAFEFYGARASNPRWSWSARSSDGAIVVLTLWKDELRRRNGKTIYVAKRRSSGSNWINRAGNRERLENLKWARDHCKGLFHVVLAVAEDEHASPRRILRCNPRPDLVMRITYLDEETGEFRAVKIRSRKTVSEYIRDQSTSITPMLLFRIGYMRKYSGPAEITNGGSYVERTGEGAEMWNFQNVAGRCYGYVMTKNAAGLDLSHLQAARDWRMNDELGPVDVVFIAKKNAGKQVVIGWYKNAVVFQKTYRKRPNPSGSSKWKNLDYLCEAAFEDAFLLPERSRTFEIPYAPAHGRGYPGHSNVWYGSKSKNGKSLLERLRKYIDQTSRTSNTKQTSKKGSTFGFPLEAATILAIEKASMEATAEYYKQRGFKIEEVHREYCGWDITATRKNVIYQVEVKGHLGDVIQFELTPNEYQKMQLLYETYRVSVVRRALESKRVELYSPIRNVSGAWELWGPRKTVISLGERIGAKASELFSNR
jgi:Protein NO VEIN, C-terminal